MYNRTNGTQNNSTNMQSRANASSGPARQGNAQNANGQPRQNSQPQRSGGTQRGPARTVNRTASQQRTAGGAPQQFRQSSASGVRPAGNGVSRENAVSTAQQSKKGTKKEAVNRLIKRVNKTNAEIVKGTVSGYKTVIRKKDIVREEGSIDYVFLVLVLILVAFGTVMVYSASYAYARNEYGDSYHFLFRQCVFIAVGALGMFVTSRMEPRWFIALSPIYYVFCTLAMIAVLFIGTEHGGAKRWIDVGFTELQPSEFMKLGLIMLLACYVDINYEKITDRNNLFRATIYGTLMPVLMIGFTCLLVIVQPHLSGAIIMFLIGMIMIYMSGSPLHLLGAFAGAGGTIFLLVGLFTPYMRNRLDTWFHPENDPQGSGFQTLQGLYAIGSGGLFGEGLGNSYQKHHFVSQPQNDFIFTILCEELGFVGAMAVIALFIMLIWRGIKIAMKATDVFSTMLVLGIIGKLALQTVMNIAVVTNTIPNTGVSLPFFSYGGSALIVAMAEMGMVLSISRYSKISK